MSRDGDPRSGLSPLLLIGTALVCLLVAGLVTGLYSARRQTREDKGAAARAAFQREFRQRIVAQDAVMAEAGAAPGGAPVPVELAAVGVWDAMRLSGRPVLVTYALLDNDDGRGAYTVSSNAGPDDDEDRLVERSVWVPAGKRVEKAGTAPATLYVIRHQPDRGDEGTAFPGWIELRAVLDP
jgi:hypothetical protein